MVKANIACFYLSLRHIMQIKYGLIIEQYDISLIPTLTSLAAALYLNKYFLTMVFVFLCIFSPLQDYEMFVFKLNKYE